MYDDDLDEYELYPTDEETYENYELEVALGLREPQNQEVEKRIFSSYAVSTFDTHSQHTPNIRLPQNPNVRMRLAGGGG